MPCSASIAVTGLPSLAYSASTAWAIAFMPETTDRCAGMPNVRSTSYTIVRGSTFGDRNVVLRPCSVCPRMGVASEPAYVVGMTICGKSVLRASALLSPVVDPPPSATRQSGSSSFSLSRTRSVTSTGVCIVASVESPAARSPNRPSTCAAAPLA